ncbi:MAG: DUF4215 domain-containing protein, partial [Candidatus Binatia bacterium]
VQTSFGSQADVAYAVVRQPNGKIVIAGPSAVGTSWRFALARYEDDGSPYLSFGTAGKVVTVLRASDFIHAIALQPDGKLVGGGGSSATTSGPLDAAFARYNPDGTLDGSFGTGGVVIAAVAPTSDIIDVVLQPDGKLVASGGGYTNSTGYAALVLRLGTNGALDPTFGTGGAVITNVSQAQSLQGVLVQPDGGIVAAGWRYDFSVPTQDFLLLRLDTAGGLDPGFGSGGIVVTDMGGGDTATTLRRQLDGRLVAMGAAGSGARLALARYEGTPPACGNGVPEPPERCDDGNLTPADGCDASCNVESGFACVGMPSVCTLGCGDGTINGSEACDDGGLAAADGCDVTCQLEPGWTCAGEPSSCASVCGDSRVVGDEQCDDGNTRNGDCCDASCHFESAGSPCLDDGDLCTSDVCGAGGVCQHEFVLELCPVCGDGLVMGDEECEDGNTANGDCCDASCHFEPAGSPCLEDGDLCSNDTCGTGGVCQHDVAPDPACLLPTAPAKAQVKIVATLTTKDQVQFK